MATVRQLTAVAPHLLHGVGLVTCVGGMERSNQAGDSCHRSYWIVRCYDLWLHVRGQDYFMQCNDHAVLHLAAVSAPFRQFGAK